MQNKQVTLLKEIDFSSLALAAASKGFAGLLSGGVALPAIIPAGIFLGAAQSILVGGAIGAGLAAASEQGTNKAQREKFKKKIAQHKGKTMVFQLSSDTDSISDEASFYSNKEFFSGLIKFFKNITSKLPDGKVIAYLDTAEQAFEYVEQQVSYNAILSSGSTKENETLAQERINKNIDFKRINDIVLIPVDKINDIKQQMQPNSSRENEKTLEKEESVEKIISAPLPQTKEEAQQIKKEVVELKKYFRTVRNIVNTQETQAKVTKWLKQLDDKGFELDKIISGENTTETPKQLVDDEKLTEALDPNSGDNDEEEDWIDDLLEEDEEEETEEQKLKKKLTDLEYQIQDAKREVDSNSIINQIKRIPVKNFRSWLDAQEQELMNTPVFGKKRKEFLKKKNAPKERLKSLQAQKQELKQALEKAVKAVDNAQQELVDRIG